MRRRRWVWVGGLVVVLAAGIVGLERGFGSDPLAPLAPNAVKDRLRYGRTQPDGKPFRERELTLAGIDFEAAVRTLENEPALREWKWLETPRGLAIAVKPERGHGLARKSSPFEEWDQAEEWVAVETAEASPRGAFSARHLRHLGAWDVAWARLRHLGRDPSR